MTANELETRTLAAEKDAALIRQLITDFKAHKDSQLSDLTGQVNTANAAVTTAAAAQKKAEDEATAAQAAAEKATADAATAKAASDAAVAAATAARDKAGADLAALEARSKELASRARTEFAALATAMQNLKAISEEANKGFDEAEAAAKAKAIADAEALVAKLKA